MQSYEEKLESMSGFLMRTRGLAAEDARREARGHMGNLPAWKDMQDG